MHIDIRNNIRPSGQNLELWFTTFLLFKQSQKMYHTLPQSPWFPNTVTLGAEGEGAPWQVLRIADLEHKDSMLAQAVLVFMPIACHMNYKHIPFIWVTCNRTIHRIPAWAFPACHFLGSAKSLPQAWVEIVHVWVWTNHRETRVEHRERKGWMFSKTKLWY